MSLHGSFYFGINFGDWDMRTETEKKRDKGKAYPFGIDDLLEIDGVWQSVGSIEEKIKSVDDRFQGEASYLNGIRMGCGDKSFINIDFNGI